MHKFNWKWLKRQVRYVSTAHVHWSHRVLLETSLNFRSNCTLQKPEHDQSVFCKLFFFRFRSHHLWAYVVRCFFRWNIKDPFKTSQIHVLSDSIIMIHGVNMSGLCNVVHVNLTRYTIYRLIQLTLELVNGNNAVPLSQLRAYNSINQSYIKLYTANALRMKYGDRCLKWFLL